ncbi:MAG: hypothetical protein R6X35_16675, partial [Candidatus Krumholzibacteriia bacterium]
MDKQKFDAIINEIHRMATAKGDYILHDQINELLVKDVAALGGGHAADLVDDGVELLLIHRSVCPHLRWSLPAGGRPARRRSG